MAVIDRTRFRSDFDLGRFIQTLGPRPRKEFRVRVRRPDDHLVFDILFENLKLETDGSPRLERTGASTSAYLIVEFPPQSFAEEAFLEMSSVNEVTDKRPQNSDLPRKHTPPPANEPLPPLPSARVRMSGTSRLAFTMPANETSLPFTLVGVLKAMGTWPLRLAPTALPDPEPGTWLEAVVHSEGWARTTSSLATALESAGAQGSAKAIEAAAARVVDRAAGALMGSARHVLGQVTVEAMQAEIDDLHARFPALKRGLAHQAGIAALALATTETLVTTGLLAQNQREAVHDLPYLSILLAPRAPRGDVTALELPYRVVLSPIEDARWAHRDGLVVHRGRTELWHTRLTTAPTDSGPDQESKVRAIWSPDYPTTRDEIVAQVTSSAPFRTSLDPLDRQMLVQNMAGYDEVEKNGRVYTPRSSRARRLHLTSLGALLDVEGSWLRRPDPSDLEQWRHLAAVGRDAYVRVVYAGFLCCLGHAASLVKVTERKFEGPSNQRVAALRQRFFIVVREPVKVYEPSTHAFWGRNFPFTSAQILTKVTPNLSTPGAGRSALTGFDYAGNNVAPRMVFWPMVQGTGGSLVDFRFEVAATDITGQKVSFSMPLLFVSDVQNDSTRTIPAVKQAYNESDRAQKRQADLGSATVCFAPFDPGDEGDPRLPTSSMTFSAGDLRGFRTMQPNFYPETERATVGIRAVQKLLGQPDAISDVTYPSVYKQHGFGEIDPTQNAGQVFLQAIGAPHKLTFGGEPSQAKSDALGALAAPQMSILGLSRITGPVAGQPPTNLEDGLQIEAALKNVIGNKFDPADFFDGATILGGVELADILDSVTSLAGATVPKLLSRQFPDRVESSFDWSTEVTEADPQKLMVPRADTARPTLLEMHSRMIAPLGDPAAATYEATASITNFKVNLFGFIILWFDELNFAARKGQKPDVAVRLHGADAVRFGGALEFVNELRDLIPSSGFSDAAGLTVTPSGIGAAFSLNLPAISVGIFSLSNASLGASFDLPFDARPASVRFNFSTREQPFSLTVSLLGGGGFFAIGISARGVQEIEAALEFGASLAINLGVASGSVEIKAGVYFHWLEKIPDKGSVELAGYVRLHGELTVIGLISASLTFNLQLGYKKEGDASTVYGEATLMVEVEVLLFSVSVSVQCRREFGGSSADPKFIDLVPDLPTWADYCGAFADEGI